MEFGPNNVFLRTNAALPASGEVGAKRRVGALNSRSPPVDA